MFVVANRVPVAAGWENSFEERFRQRAGQIEKQAGFVRMQVLRPQTEETPYVVLTTWQDRASFDAWVGSDDFKAAHRNPMPRDAFQGEGKLEMHEVIVSAEAN